MRRRSRVYAGGGTPLAQFLAAMSQPPNDTVTAALRTFFDTLNSTGLLDTIAIGYLMNLHTQQASRLNFRQPTRFALTDNLNAPTWVSGVGGAGGFTAAASSPLSTGWQTFNDGGSVVTQNSAGATVRSRTSALSTSFDFGDSSRIHARLRTTGDLSQARVMSASAISTTAGTVTDGSGIFAFNRVDASNFSVRRDKVAVETVASASTTLNTGAVAVCGVIGASTSPRRLSFFAVHGSHSDAQADAFHDAIDAFDTAIGAS